MAATRSVPARSVGSLPAALLALPAAASLLVTLAASLLVALAVSLLVALLMPATPARAANQAGAGTVGLRAGQPFTGSQPDPAGQPDGQPGGQPGMPGPTVFVEVTPTMVQPGNMVGIRASCHDNSVGDTVVSDAFGEVAVHPQRGLLYGTAMVRDRVQPGNYRVKLECRGGESASTMIQVVRKVKPTPGPATGFGGTAGGVTAGLLLPGGLALTVSGMVLWIVAVRRRGTRR